MEVLSLTNELIDKIEFNTGSIDTAHPVTPSSSNFIGTAKTVVCCWSGLKKEEGVKLSLEDLP